MVLPHYFFARGGRVSCTPQELFHSHFLALYWDFYAFSFHGGKGSTTPFLGPPGSWAIFRDACSWTLSCQGNGFCLCSSCYLPEVNLFLPWLALSLPLSGNNNRAFGRGESFLPSQCACPASVTLAAATPHCLEGSEAGLGHPLPLGGPGGHGRTGFPRLWPVSKSRGPAGGSGVACAIPGSAPGCWEVGLCLAPACLASP